MPREIVKKPRFIYPQIATSLSIAEVSAMAELLFWRILPQADDQGRLPGDPRQLKAIACPMRKELTEDDIPSLLAELEKAKLIICYSNSSTNYIQIAKWWDYQGAMRRIFPSHYPAPEGWQDQIKGVSGSSGQPPTNADDVRPEEEEEGEKEPETETRIMEPEREEEGTATPTTKTNQESRTVSTIHLGLLSFLETLKGWRFERGDDLAWVKDFCNEWPDFNLALAKACRDYHSGKSPPKHKGHWKNRFREWMRHEKQFQEERRGTKDKRGKVHPRQDFSSRKW